MYYTAYGLVNSPEPRVQPLLPDVTPVSYTHLTLPTILLV